MSIALNIQIFLISKLKELKMKRKDFILGSGITSAGASGLINAVHVNPTLISIIKIANFFNCSIDEILGRNKYLNLHNKVIFNQISSDEIINTIKYYITCELKKRNITALQLAKSCGIGKDTILKYLNTNHAKYHLSTKSLLAIADYFEVSIDKMTGRVNS